MSLVQSFAKTSLLSVGGFVAHRFVTALLSGLLGSVVDPRWANVLSGAAALVAGAVGANKVLPGVAVPLTLGMATSFGTTLLRDLFPDVAARLGVGRVGYESTQPRYVLQGTGQPLMQAAAGEYMAQQLYGTGEYISSDLAPVSGTGEYVASSLDIQGYGDYEIQDTYAPSGDSMGMVNDGVLPSSDLNQEFNIMEAAAGIGQPIMQASAGMGQPILQASAGMGISPEQASIYIPSQPARLVSDTGGPVDSGIFDIGGGNGVLS
jgi:hypothetical protein